MSGLVKSMYARPRLRMVVAPEAKLDDVLSPHFLWQLATEDESEPGDIIDVRHDGHRFIVELYVADIDPISETVFCHVLNQWVFDPAVLAGSVGTAGRQGEATPLSPPVDHLRDARI